MSPIIILVISIVLVVAGILVCKLHAFLALLLAALVAAFLTSESALETYALDDGEQSFIKLFGNCLLYTSPSPRDLSTSRMPSSA